MYVELNGHRQRATALQRSRSIRCMSFCRPFRSPSIVAASVSVGVDFLSTCLLCLCARFKRIYFVPAHIYIYIYILSSVIVPSVQDTDLFPLSGLVYDGPVRHFLYINSCLKTRPPPSRPHHLDVCISELRRKLFHEIVVFHFSSPASYLHNRRVPGFCLFIFFMCSLFSRKAVTSQSHRFRCRYGVRTKRRYAS